MTNLVGCTDPLAKNYLDTFQYDNGSCRYDLTLESTAPSLSFAFMLDYFNYQIIINDDKTFHTKHSGVLETTVSNQPEGCYNIHLEHYSYGASPPTVQVFLSNNKLLADIEPSVPVSVRHESV